jgi:hypothetical protein
MICATESIIIKKKEVSAYNQKNLIQNELKHAPTPILIPNLKINANISFIIKTCNVTLIKG